MLTSISENTRSYNNHIVIVSAKHRPSVGFKNTWSEFGIDDDNCRVRF